MLHRYLYLLYRLRELRRFQADAQRSREVQHQVLMTKLRRNAESDFGKNHGFSAIRSLSDFRRQVPVSDYEYFRPYIDRVKQGQQSALFGSKTKVLMLALTSGTTNKSKYIPVTQEFFDEYRRGWNLWGIGTYRDHQDLLYKWNLKLASNWRQFLTEGGIPCGNISGLVMDTAPRMIRRRFVVPSEAFRIEDPLAKHYTALRLAIVTPQIGMFGTANPSTLVEFAKLADKNRQSLVRDIHDGTLSEDFDVPSEIRQTLGSRTGRRHPGRARQLEAIIERTGTLYPRDFWPQLSVVPVWQGGSVGVYLPQLEQYYGQPALRDHGLSASEGRMTVPLRDGTSEGMIEYIHHFFEFIPEEEHDGQDPTVLEAHELQVDRNYYILLTTSAGLYRYDIHDVVRCVGFHGEAPILKFLNKGAHFSSITGEKLSEHQVVTAVGSSQEELGMTVQHFTLAPVMGETPGYVMLLEADDYDGPQHELARTVEMHLQRQNWEYAEKRKSGRLRPLEIREIPKGTWSNYRAQKTADRGNFEEYKHPCLVGDLGFVEQLTGSQAEVA